MVESSESDDGMSMMLLGAAGGAVLVLLLVGAVAICKKKRLKLGPVGGGSGLPETDAAVAMGYVEHQEAVRKTPFAPFLYPRRTFCQDGLGTNMRKPAPKKGRAFRFSQGPMGSQSNALAVGHVVGRSDDQMVFKNGSVRP
jgi:hypothetical protein